MSKYAGTKTEKNLMEAFAGESQAAINTPIMHQQQKRQDLYRWQIFLKKPQTRKKSMQKCGLRSFMVSEHRKKT